MFERPTRQDFYQVLDVPYDATTDDIQAAYEQARRIYAHDAMVAGTVLSEDERRATFRRISEAYQTLIAEESRRLYDRTLPYFSQLHQPAKTPSVAKISIRRLDRTSGEGDIEPKSVEPSPITVHFAPPVIDIATKLKPEGRRDAFPKLVKGSQPEAKGAPAARLPGAPELGIEPTTPDPANARGPAEAGRPAQPDEPDELEGPGLDDGSEDVLIPVLGPSDEATGAFLRSVRQARGLTLDEIAKETKISTTMLGDIESERLDRLPAPIYLRNFTGQMAEMLGLDVGQVSRTYLSRVQRLLAP